MCDKPSLLLKDGFAVEVISSLLNFVYRFKGSKIIYSTAMHSISTSVLRGSVLTATHL